MKYKSVIYYNNTEFLAVSFVTVCFLNWSLKVHIPFCEVDGILLKLRKVLHTRNMLKITDIEQLSDLPG